MPTPTPCQRFKFLFNSNFCSIQIFVQFKFSFNSNFPSIQIFVQGPDLFTSGAEGPNQLTQLATPILTSKIGLGDESGPDIR
jgi:hypothetical protein